MHGVGVEGKEGVGVGIGMYMNDEIYVMSMSIYNILESVLFTSSFSFVFAFASLQELFVILFDSALIFFSHSPFSFSPWAWAGSCRLNLSRG
jgi:hypothetical protein